MSRGGAHVRRPVVAGVLLLALAGCGVPQDVTPGSPASPPPRSDIFPDPCTLITVSDVQTALGESVGPGALDPETAGGGTCTWSGGFEGADSVLLQIGPAAIEQRVNAAPGAVPEQGLGDAAVDNHGEIFVRKNDVGLLVQIVKIGAHSDDDDAAAHHLASVAVSHL